MSASSPCHPVPLSPCHLSVDPRDPRAITPAAYAAGRNARLLILLSLHSRRAPVRLTERDIKGRPVVCVELRLAFRSAAAAARHIGGCGSGVANVLSGLALTYRGLHWEPYDQSKHAGYQIITRADRRECIPTRPKLKDDVERQERKRRATRECMRRRRALLTLSPLHPVTPSSSERAA